MLVKLPFIEIDENAICLSTVGGHFIILPYRGDKANMEIYSTVYVHISLVTPVYQCQQRFISLLITYT